MSTPSPTRHLAAALLLLVLGSACASTTSNAPEQTDLKMSAWPEAAKAKSDAKDDGDGVSTVETFTQHTNIEAGLGFEERARVVAATELVQQKRYREAEVILNDVLKKFESKMVNDGTVYISVASAKEVELFEDNLADGRRVVWLDWAFREALHLKAFLAATFKEFEDALEILQVEASFAPFSAAVHCERGFVLNQLKRPSEGLKAYKHATEIAKRFESAIPDLPVALRGVGFSLIELGDLDGAEAAYVESLKLQPNNPIALKELEFIRQLRNKNKEKKP